MTNFDSDGVSGALFGPGSTDSWVIALDGGTTNTRARLVHGSRVVATARRAVGVRDTVLSDPRSSPALNPAEGAAARREGLVRAVREVIEEVAGDRASEGQGGAGEGPGSGPRRAYLVAAGMLSSEVGLVAIPHVPAPAGVDDLAKAAVFVNLPEIDDRPILVVPGIRTPAAEGRDAWFASDVMRGEECETFGAHAALLAEGRIAPGQASVFLWPGSHTKLVAVDVEGRITGSFTTLAGEMLQAVARHTLVSASLPGALPDEPDPVAAAAGARAAEHHGLGRAAFLVRIAAMTGTLEESARASFWIGAVVASDLEGLAGHAILEPGRPVFVGGREPLRSLYADGLSRRHDGPVVALHDRLAEAASALGACAVAARRR
jgi:2-dehydro-3-deoxygalactonokinase